MAEIEATFDSRELQEWMAYYSIEPFGEDRADLRMGILASLWANIYRDPKRRTEPWAPYEFMPFYEKPEPAAETPEQLAERLKAAFNHPSVKRSMN